MNNLDLIHLLMDNSDVNVTLIECLKYEDVEIFDVGASTACFRLKNSGICMLGGSGDGLILDNLPLNAKNYFTPNIKIAEILKVKTGRRVTTCIQVIYTAVNIKNTEGVTVKKLPADEQTAKFIADRYTLNYSVQEVMHILQTRVMLGAYVNGEIAGFIGMHEERSVGMLEVFDGYRRMGLGTLLINEMVKYFLDEGYKPFSHIISTNEKSINLHKKMDCEIQKEAVYWL